MNNQPDTIQQHQERWAKALDARAMWTREAWLDLRFESGKVWTQDELEIFRAQNRDPSNWNIIRPTIELVCGIEAQNRSDLKMLPRVSAHAQAADALTKLEKYVSDQNHGPRQLSRAFRWAAKTGIGWLETCYSPDPFEEQIQYRCENSFNIWVDPSSKEPNLSDARDVFRAKWAYPEHLALRFPKLADAFREFGGGESYDPLSHTADYTNKHGDRPSVAQFNEGYGGDPEYGPGHGLMFGMNQSGYTQESEIRPRNRYNGQVMAVERWYKVEEIALFARFKNGMVLENTPKNQAAIAKAVVAGEALLVRQAVNRYRVAVFVNGTLLQDMASPYTFRGFPFVPMWAYEDENGVPSGLVRMYRDAQKDFNARRTHMLRRAISNAWAYEADAFTDEDEALYELRQHDGNVRLRPGGMEKFKRLEDLESSQIDAKLLDDARAYIQDQSGVTRELMGQESNADSGVAIQKRQSQGQTSLFTLFENRNAAQILVGERVMAMIQDTYTDAMEVRITGDAKAPQFLKINQQDPENPGVVVNDITQGRFDVIVTQAPESPSDRAAKANNIAGFLKSMPPQLQLMFAAELADLNDLPTDFVEQVRAFAQQQQNTPPPAPRKTIQDIIKIGLPDLTASERAQVLQSMQIQPDPNGPPQPDGETPEQEAAEQPKPAPPLDPNKVMDARSKVIVANIKHAHDAEQANAERQHALALAVAQRSHELGMASTKHVHAAHVAAQQHQQSLEQARQAAALAPPPTGPQEA